MPIEIETKSQEKDATLSPIANTGLMVVEPTELEQTSEFETWLQQKVAEVQRYLKLSFNQDVPVEKLVFHLAHLGYPDPVGQLRSHARIWGYNYKIKGENVIDPATGQLMSYVVWQKLDPPVTPIEIADPPLESDTDTSPEEFDAEPATTVTTS